MLVCLVFFLICRHYFIIFALRKNIKIQKIKRLLLQEYDALLLGKFKIRSLTQIAFSHLDRLATIYRQSLMMVIIMVLYTIQIRPPAFCSIWRMMCSSVNTAPPFRCPTLKLNASNLKLSLSLYSHLLVLICCWCTPHMEINNYEYKTRL